MIELGFTSTEGYTLIIVRVVLIGPMITRLSGNGAWITDPLMMVPGPKQICSGTDARCHSLLTTPYSPVVQNIERPRQTHR